jgi:hypothetical protein
MIYLFVGCLTSIVNVGVVAGNLEIAPRCFGGFGMQILSLSFEPYSKLQIAKKRKKKRKE